MPPISPTTHNTSNTRPTLPLLNLPSTISNLPRSFQRFSQDIFESILSNPFILTTTLLNQIQIRPDNPPTLTITGAPTPSYIQIETNLLISILERDHGFRYDRDRNILTRVGQGNEGIRGIPQLDGTILVEDTRRGPIGEQTAPTVYTLSDDLLRAEVDTRNDAILPHTRIIHALNLVPRGNWNGFIRRGDNSTNPTIYYLQFDDLRNPTIWDSNRNAYRLDENGQLLPPQANTDPKPHTIAIAELGLFPLRNRNDNCLREDGSVVPRGEGVAGSIRGSFRRPGDPGFFLLAPGGGNHGRIFYTGGVLGNRTYASCFFIRNSDGRWVADSSTTGRGITLPTRAITGLSRMRACLLPDGTWGYFGSFPESHGDSLYVLNDGRILMLHSNDNDLRVYVYSDNAPNWTKLTNRTSNPERYHTDPEIARGIQAIIESRARRDWFSPSSPNTPLIQRNRQLTSLYNWALEIDLNTITNQDQRREIERRQALFRTIDRNRFPNAREANPTEESLIEMTRAYFTIIEQLKSDLSNNRDKQRIARIATLLSTNLDTILNSTDRWVYTDIQYIYQNARHRESRLLFTWADPLFLQRLRPHLQDARGELATIIQNANR